MRHHQPILRLRPIVEEKREGEEGEEEEEEKLNEYKRKNCVNMYFREPIEGEISKSAAREANEAEKRKKQQQKKKDQDSEGEEEEEEEENKKKKQQQPKTGGCDPYYTSDEEDFSDTEFSSETSVWV